MQRINKSRKRNPKQIKKKRQKWRFFMIRKYVFSRHLKLVIVQSLLYNYTNVGFNCCFINKSALKSNFDISKTL